MQIHLNRYTLHIACKMVPKTSYVITLDNQVFTEISTNHIRDFKIKLYLWF